MVLTLALCPYCGSENVVKNGRYSSGRQRYTKIKSNPFVYDVYI